jgi:hypothetical protein
VFEQFQNTKKEPFSSQRMSYIERCEVERFDKELNVSDSRMFSTFVLSPLQQNPSVSSLGYNTNANNITI